MDMIWMEIHHERNLNDDDEKPNRPLRNKNKDATLIRQHLDEYLLKQNPIT